MLLVVFSLLRNLAMVRSLFLTWAGIGALTAIRGCIQFAGKVQEAHRLGRNFYEFYVGERITGFTSHWNTYSAEEMFALIMLASYLLFAPAAKRRVWIWMICGALIALAIVLGETRGIWIAVAIALLYLVWFWRRWMVALAPVVLLGAYFVAPAAMQDRVNSIFKPKGADSNQFRVVTWRTGMRMVERHPWFGLGPEGPKLHFDEYVPADIPRPLPSGWYGHLHNIYLHYAAERGIPTMLILMWMLIQILVDFWRGLKALAPGPSNQRFLLHGGIAAVLATMAEGFVELNLGDSEVLTMFLVVVACGYLALEKELADRRGRLVPHILRTSRSAIQRQRITDQAELIQSEQYDRIELFARCQCAAPCSMASCTRRFPRGGCFAPSQIPVASAIGSMPAPC